MSKAAVYIFLHSFELNESVCVHMYVHVYIFSLIFSVFCFFPIFRMATRKGKGEESCRSLSSDFKLCKSGCQGGRKQTGKKEKQYIRMGLENIKVIYLKFEVTESIIIQLICRTFVCY